MAKNSVQRWAFATLFFVILLVFIGATVRVTGAGLGCPDWPTCWGKLIPPWDVSQVDFDKLPVERFQKKAVRLGRDPSEVTVASLKREFNPRHVWTEYLNRLSSLPVAVCSLGLLLFAFIRRGTRGKIRLAAVGSVLLVGANALLGALVVSSRLQSGFITVHLFLAFLLLFLLVYIVWAGGDSDIKPQIFGPGKGVVITILLLVVVESLMGSQIREMTDELQKEYGTESRSDWIIAIEESAFFLIHRSFSWIIVVAAAVGWWQWRRANEGETEEQSRVPTFVMLIVFAFMLMGIIFSHYNIHAVIQVLHVGLASVLTSLSFYWLLAAEQLEA